MLISPFNNLTQENGKNAFFMHIFPLFFFIAEIKIILKEWRKLELCIPQSEIFQSNYDKIICILLDGLTTLNIEYNESISEILKKKLKENIAMLEELLRIKSSNSEYMDDSEYFAMKNFIKALISN